ncbi:uncharacterized protein N7506_005742 [Penicillium brevicompactum]|uniref:uncharacterized protein n=1 Tax=Penicillium brevicompactum TaxID=5074 RepID=UPI002541886C|nr:uncharacterized protein N7506_005742 [Penicillium brevicompactum]KAJ5335806.1 hypothetical protein N7506_005742 [Penicillium brevicompactum]
MDNTFFGQDADDEDEGGGPNFFLDPLLEQRCYLPQLVTIDPIAPGATGGAAPPVEPSFGTFQPMNGISGLADTAILNQSESTGDYMDCLSL